eukprot:278204-Rhodomonas_salina.2
MSVPGIAQQPRRQIRRRLTCLAFNAPFRTQLLCHDYAPLRPKLPDLVVPCPRSVPRTHLGHGIAHTGHGIEDAWYNTGYVIAHAGHGTAHA